MNAPPFFIGWSRALPPALARFLTAVAAALLGTALLLGLLLGATADDPAPDLASVPDGPVALEGTLLARPYPLVVGDDGHTVILFGDGKRGAVPGAAAGQRVAIAGYRFGRGDIGNVALDAAPRALGPGTPPKAVPLGTWRITGEICDGKCAVGAMRPGTGLAHRACAVLCLEGGLPPVLVATAPVAGHRVLLLADAAGGPLDAASLRLTGLRVTLEGEVERLGDLLVLRVAR